MKIQTLKCQELSLLFKYASLEGWDVEELHILALLNAHPNDFFIAYKKEKLIGFIVAIKHSHEFGFISSFLVLKEFRGLGYGRVIFNFALKHLQGCQIALDSVIDKEKLYKNAGFKSYFDVITYKFISGSLEVTHLDMQTIEYDENLTLLSNPYYMNTMIKDKRVSYKAILKDDDISSCAFTFPYKDGYKINIESTDIDEAITLFFALSDKLPNKTAIYLQATKLSPLHLTLIQELQMSQDSKLSRMYNKILD